VWKSAIILQLFVVKPHEWSINAIIQNPVYSHTYYMTKACNMVYFFVVHFKEFCCLFIGLETKNRRTIDESCFGNILEGKNSDLTIRGILLSFKFVSR
jgi:hypothetical protein